MDKYMIEAIKQAKIAQNKGNIPVGAVIVMNNKIISKAYNKKNSKKVSIYHAEILAIIKACKKLKSWRLNECDLYVTLEPCNMCLSAIGESRIKNVYYLLKSNYKDVETANKKNIRINKLLDIYGYNEILSDFFKDKRK
ncbi:MAG TPA: nucleoside deaminase [Bacilli bacterium]|nr:nucleoside deaminase [Bacilli bacterium]